MMRLFLVMTTAAALGLTGCNRPRTTASGVDAHGRYSGIGIYPAGRLWAQMVGGGDAKDAAVSKLMDDEHVIVVVDSKTGEVRQCGNLTGYCVGMNPWGGALATSQTAPVRLGKHAEQLDSEARAKAGDTAAK